MLFKLEEIQPFTIIGERECIQNMEYPVQIMADSEKVHLLIIHKKEVDGMFKPREIEKLLITSTVNFPTEKQIVDDVVIARKM